MVDLYASSLKKWEQITQIRQQIRLTLYGLLKSLVKEQQFEFTWLTPTVLDNNLVQH